MKLMHCISGLPRSGSTLLSAILKQNPKFFAAITDPLCGFIASVAREFEYNGTYQKILTTQKKIELLQNIIETYYKDIDAELCFNTSRQWTSQIELLAKVSPETKLICCVRDIPSILNSFEKLKISNILSPTKFMYGRSYSVYERADVLMRGDNIVGESLDFLKQAYYGEYSQNLILVEYDNLVSYPQETMKKIYTALNLEHYDHDFNNLNFEERLDDPYKPHNMHHITKEIRKPTERLIIPPDICRKFSGLEFWRE